MGECASFAPDLSDTHPFPCFRFLEALMLYESSCSRNPGWQRVVCIKHTHCPLQSHLHVCIPRQTVIVSAKFQTFSLLPTNLTYWRWLSIIRKHLEYLSLGSCSAKRKISTWDQKVKEAGSRNTPATIRLALEDVVPLSRIITYTEEKNWTLFKIIIS